MKKICLFLGLLCVPTLASADKVYLGNNISNLNSVMHSAEGDTYYKCNNSVSVSGCSSTYIVVSYSYKSGGLGTMSSPYILGGCTFDGCACDTEYYLSGNTCVKCSDNTWGAKESGTAHTNTKCNYCPPSRLALVPAPNVFQCLECPMYGICNGSTTLKCAKNYYKSGVAECTHCPGLGWYAGEPGTAAAGATSITECYLKAGDIYDNTGRGQLVEDCWYTY